MPNEALSREQRRNAKKVLGAEAVDIFERVERNHAQLAGRIQMFGQKLHAEIEERKRSGATRDKELEKLQRELAILRDEVVVPLGKKVLALEVAARRHQRWSVDDARGLAELTLAYGSTTWRERLRWLFTGRPPARSLGRPAPGSFHVDDQEEAADVPDRQ